MIFITGIAGFVGSNLANELYRRGYEVMGCDNLQFGYPENVNEDIWWTRQGFESLSEEAINQHHTLIHCATANIIYGIDHPIETFATNALNTILLFQKFKGKIIYTSTASVYGNQNKLPACEDAPHNVSNAYDQSKLIAEIYLRLRGNYTTLRLSNVYGRNQRPENPYSGVVAKFIDSVESDRPIEIIGDGLATRDFTYIDDTVGAIIRAIDMPAQNTEINISSGVETSIMKLAHDILEIYDKPFYCTFKENRAIDCISRRWLDIEKAGKLLDWKPKFNLQKGLKELIC